MSETRKYEEIEHDFRTLEAHLEHYPDASLDIGCVAALQRLGGDLRYFMAQEQMRNATQSGEGG